MEMIGGRRSNGGTEVFSWPAADRLPAADTDRTESIVESKDLPALSGGLAAAKPGTPEPHRPPAAKHNKTCLRAS
jgi:hypothetical protein